MSWFHARRRVAHPGRWTELRERMVEEQLVERGIRDSRLLEAFRRVPREAFVPPELADHAYEDRALPIGFGQSISQPYVIALTLNALALEGWERVLEVGTGTGYVAALLSCLTPEIFTIERIPALARAAAQRLHKLGFRVEVAVGDGTLGWPGAAPFDAIAISAAGPQVPPPLVAQLSARGRIALPIKSETSEQLFSVWARGGVADWRSHADVRFVPLIGQHGFGPSKSRHD